MGAPVLGTTDCGLGVELDGGAGVELEGGAGVELEGCAGVELDGCAGTASSVGSSSMIVDQL